jgi:hypothetical protein
LVISPSCASGIFISPCYAACDYKARMIAQTSPVAVALLLFSERFRPLHHGIPVFAYVGSAPAKCAVRIAIEWIVALQSGVSRACESHAKIIKTVHDVF